MKNFLLKFFFSLFGGNSLLQSMNDMAEQMGRGDFSRRLLISRKSPLSRLAETMNAAAQNLELNVQGLQRAKNHLTAILQSVEEGILVTDFDGKIISVNPALENILAMTANWEGKTVLECMRNNDIHEAMQQTLKTHHSVKQEIVLTWAGENRHIILHAAPLKDKTSIEGCVAVFYDVTEIRKVEKIRKEFVANVSHELKTPLTSIRGYAETLRRGALQQPEVALSFLEKIESNALQLQQLVESMLKLSAIESGKVDLNPLPIPFKETLGEFCKNFQSQLEAKKISLVCNVPASCKIVADAQALRTIFSNLIDNAIQYTPAGGTIQVFASPEENGWKISVSDSGVGIPSQDLPHVFERFYRVEKSRSRNQGGTGLGLSIVKHLVQAHGGTATAESKPGEGACFTFTLPVAN